MTRAQQNLTLLILAWVALAVWTVAAMAAPIPGFSVGLNDTGFNTGGGVYVPITGPGQPGTGQWKPEYLARFLADFRPKSQRKMDLWQIVTNPTTTWANRSLNDYGEQGITYETTINLDKASLALNPNYTPWLNSPFFADEDHDEQLGYLYGTTYPGPRVIVSKGNEGWAPFGQNIPAQNLFLARAEEPGVNDLTAAGHRWGRQLGKSVAAFRRGWVRAGRDPAGVQMAVEGFAPVTQWAQSQIDGMRAIGIDPRDYGAHVSIAQYAAGSDTDLTGPLGTPAEKRDAVKRFIDTLVGWTLQHRQLARANGLVDVVDAYEMRLGTHSPTPDWIAFQNTPEQGELQDYGFRKLIEASGGVGATLNLEGLVGFPFTSGIFSLADWPSQFNDPYQSQAYAAVHDLIDVPEPNLAVLVVVAVAMLAARGRKGRK